MGVWGSTVLHCSAAVVVTMLVCVGKHPHTHCAVIVFSVRILSEPPFVGSVCLYVWVRIVFQLCKTSSQQF